MSELLKTPTDLPRSTSTKPSGSCTYNGEPGLPERSAHPGGVDEVTYDRTTGLKSGDKK